MLSLVKRIGEIGRAGYTARYSNGSDLEVVFTTLEDEPGKPGRVSRLMEVLKIEEPISRILWAETYWTNEDGDVLGRFNPMIIGNRWFWAINSNWILEATPENEAKFLEEIQRRYVGDYGW